MSALKREMRAALPGDVIRFEPWMQKAPTATPGLRYSSARPWILALAISSALWVGIGWLIWKLV